MKYLKLLSVCLLISLLLSSVGCIDINSSNNGQDNLTTNDTINSTTQDTELYVCPPYTSCVFYSIDDITTYLNTGSRNPSDYSSEPSRLLTFTEPENILPRYIPLESLFELTPTAKSTVRRIKISGSASSKGMSLLYYLDVNDGRIEIINTPSNRSEDVVEYTLYFLKARQGDKYKPPIIVEEISDIDNYHVCYVMREINGVKTLCTAVNGYITCVEFFYRDYHFRVTVASDSAKDFLSNKDIAPFSTLFSKDNDTFVEAIERIIEAIDAKEAESAANT